jgi:hypothetical protein
LFPPNHGSVKGGELLMRWHVFKKNQNLGLKSSEEIVQMIATGELQLTDHVAKEGSPIKRKIADAAELFAKKNNQSSVKVSEKLQNNYEIPIEIQSEKASLDKTVVAREIINQQKNVALNHTIVATRPELEFNQEPREKGPLRLSDIEPTKLDRQVPQVSSQLNFYDNDATKTPIGKVVPSAIVVSPQKKSPKILKEPIAATQPEAQKNDEKNQQFNSDVHSGPLHQKARITSEANLATPEKRMAWENSRVNETSQAAVYGVAPHSEFDRRTIDRKKGARKKSEFETIPPPQEGKNTLLFISVSGILIALFIIIFVKVKQKNLIKQQNTAAQQEIANPAENKLPEARLPKSDTEKKKREQNAKLEAAKKESENRQNELEAERRRELELKLESEKRREQQMRQEREAQLENDKRNRERNREKTQQNNALKESAKIRRQKAASVEEENRPSSATRKAPKSGLIPNSVSVFGNVAISEFPVAGCGPCVTSAKLEDGTTVSLISSSFVPWFQARRENKKVFSVKAFVQKKPDGSFNLIIQQIKS